MQLRHKSVHDFHHASTVLIFCILLTNTVTTALKYAAGRYRPNYMAELDTDARLSFPYVPFLWLNNHANLYLVLAMLPIHLQE